MKSIQDILNESKANSDIHKIPESKINRTIANKIKGQNPEFRKKMAAVKTGKKRNDMLGNKNIAKTEKERKRRSEAMKGIPKSAEHVENYKKAYKELPILKCPHCDMSSRNQGNMNRYHFENCKHK